MSEFSDRPFVAGTIRGLRSFRVDSLGRLNAPSAYPHIFTPGWNEAKCQRDGDSLSSAFQKLLNARIAYPTVGGVVTPTVQAAPEVEHQVASLGCSCGFYAYHDTADNPHHADGNVLAVVEGAGVCTVGTRGFRAEKVRVVAIVAPEGPKKKPKRQERPLDDLAERMHDSARLPPVGSIGLVAGIAGTVGGITTGIHWLTPIAAALLVISALAVYLSFRGIDVHYDRRREAREAAALPQPVPFEKVRAAYPDLPIYSTVEEAVAEHPLTPPPAPAPSDEDFWTRSAS